jgi:hypothetical protein
MFVVLEVVFATVCVAVAVDVAVAVVPVWIRIPILPCSMGCKLWMPVVAMVIL